MKKIIGFILCLFLCTTLSAQSKKSSIVGNWVYNAPEAPYGYQDGTMSVKETDGKLTGEVTVQGSTIKMGEIKKDGEVYSCKMYVDGYPVDIQLKSKGDVLEGSTTIDGGVMGVTFKRK